MAGFALSPRRFGPALLGASAPFRSGSLSALALSWIGMALLFVTAALSVYLVQISTVATAGYELQRLEAARNGWLARNEQLELEIAKHRSLAWVESQALQRLGMVRAQKPLYLSVQWEAQTDRQTAEAATASNGRAPGSRPTGSDPHRPEPGSPDRALEAVRTWLQLAIAR